MDIILLEPIRIGNRKRELGDTVSVKSGFARNFLIPFGKAVPATKVNIEEFAVRRQALEAKAQATLEAAQARAEALTELALTITANASDEGKLYGSIGTTEISSALQEKGHAIAKKEVILPEGAFREIGEYTVTIHLHTDVETTLTLQVIAAK
jgi:large subunit ribosomal protein L9